jgi:sugar/nucleoside kinase (ribokinase family)
MNVSADQIEVVCAGILVADIFVPPLARLPMAGELLATDDFWIDSGGCAANTATCLLKLGVPTCVVGKVGRDSFGDFVERDLTAKGVNTQAIARSDSAGTSKTVILPVKGEDRRYIHTFGANSEFRVSDIPRDLVARARVLYVGGYMVLPGFEPEALRDLLAFAQQNHVLTVLDVAVPEGVNDLLPLQALLPYVDYFTPNDHEAHLLTGQSDPVQQARCLLQAGCSTVIITQGERGVLLLNAEEQLALPAFSFELVDGSGAGDAFSAGLIAGLLQNRPLSECLRLASAIGGSACTRLGCTPGAFALSEADAYLQAHPIA